MPLGIFQSHVDKHQNDGNGIGKLALESHILTEGKEVQFRLKRLIHESVSSIEELFPYLHTELYKKDKNSDEFGWFPMEWIYAEVDIDGSLGGDFQHLYETYTNNDNNDDNDDNDNDETSNLKQNENKNYCKYNPFYMLRFPRIPLFVIEIKLKIDALQHFADEIEVKSPHELIQTFNQRCSIASQYNMDDPTKNIEINTTLPHQNSKSWYVVLLFYCKVWL